METATKRYSMSDEHKAQLAIGRDQSRIVREYLSALQEFKPKRGRKRTPETVQSRLDAIIAQLVAETDPLRRLKLIQEKADLERWLESQKASTDLSALESEFMRVVKDFSQRKGITYSAWREAGVPPHVLRDAGLARSA